MSCDGHPDGGQLSFCKGEGGGDGFLVVRYLTVVPCLWQRGREVREE